MIKTNGKEQYPKDLKITADIVYIGTAYSVRNENQVREKNCK